MDERAFFNARPETRSAHYQCPRCKRTNEYAIRWMRHSKKDRPPSGADPAARARFDKLRDYLLRIDEDVVCRTCSKKFEIPSHHSLIFLDQLEGLPNDEELEREIAAAAGDEPPRPDPPPARPDRFTRKPSGYK